MNLNAMLKRYTLTATAILVVASPNAGVITVNFSWMDRAGYHLDGERPNIFDRISASKTSGKKKNPESDPPSRGDNKPGNNR